MARMSGLRGSTTRTGPLFRPTIDSANEDRAKCWNGPMRSATVDLKCGKENALVSISEPEKCEYFFKVTSPALCWPAEESGAAGAGIKEEL